MVRRQKELQTITSKDIGNIGDIMGNKRSRFGENPAKIHKCSICGTKYTIHDSKNTNKDKKTGQPFKFPNEWNEQEITAHKLSHVESPKARRVLGKLLKLPENVREQVLDFINEHYDG